MNTEEQQPPVEVPFQQISEDALKSLIEAFILREGTDYGVVEISLDAKIVQISRQLEKGDVKIIYDPNTESVTMMTKKEWAKIH